MADNKSNEEAFAQMDVNGDGKLDFSELHEYMVKYNNQMSMNNELIKSVNDAEMRLQQQHAELKEKEATLVQTLQTMADVRSLNNDLRLKIQNLKDVISDMRRSEQDLRVQTAMGDRRCDSLEQMLGELRASQQGAEERIEQLLNEKEVLTLERNKLQGELETWQGSHGGLPVRVEQLEDQLRKVQQREQNTRVEADQLLVELKRAQDLRAQDGAAHKQAIQEHDDLRNRLETANQHIQAANAESARSKRLADGLRAQLDQEVAKNQQLESELSTERYSLSQAEGTCEQLRGQVAEAARHAEQLMTQIEQQENMRRQQEARHTEQVGGLQQRIGDLDDQVKHLINAEREGEIEVAKEKRELSSRYQSKLEHMDSQYTNLQAEFNNLHEVLRREQALKADLRKRFDDERQELHVTIEQANSQVRSLEEAEHTVAVRHRSEVARRDEEIHRLEHRIKDDMENFLQTLEIMQAQVHRLQRLSTDVRSECAALRHETNAVTGKAEAAFTGLQQPLISYAGDTRHTITGLTEQIITANAMVEDAKDSVATLTLQRDEEHGSLIMAQDQISRLQHELDGSRRQRQADEEHTRQRLRSAGAEATAAKSLVEGLEEKLQQKMEELTDSNRRNGVLQQEVQRTAAELADAQATTARQMTSIKQSLQQKSKAQRDAADEADRLRTDMETMRRQLLDHISRIDELEKEKAELMDRVHKTHAEGKEQEGRQTRHIQNLKDELQHLQEQLNRTRKLYEQVRGARDNMRVDNSRLKEEMNRFHRQLNDTIATPGDSQ